MAKEKKEIVYTQPLMRLTVLRRMAIIAAAAGIFGAYSFLKLDNLKFFASDHAIYIYMSKLLSEGVLPYRDFFFSHPPLQLIPPAITIFLFGMNFQALNLLPALAGLLSGTMILLVCLDAMCEKPEGERWAFALCACAFFLLSHVNLIATLSATGHNLATLLLLASVFLFLRRKKMWSGVVAGLAAMSGLQVLPGVAVIFLLQWFWRRAKLPALLVGFLSSFVGIHIIGATVVGSAFFAQVYGYHLAKPDETVYLAGKFPVFGFMMSAHIVLVSLATIGFIALLMRSMAKRQSSDEIDIAREKLLTASAGICAAELFFLFFMHPIFPHYFLPIAPFASIIASDAFLRMIKTWLPILRQRLASLTIPTIVGAIFLIALWTGNQTLQNYKQEQHATAFTNAAEVAARVRSLTRPDQTIYGDFGIVPLVALLSNRRIASNEVDSSVMRFASGIASVDGVMEKIKSDNIGAVLSRTKKDVVSHEPFRQKLEQSFFLSEQIEPKDFGPVIEVWLPRLRETALVIIIQ